VPDERSSDEVGAGGLERERERERDGGQSGHSRGHRGHCALLGKRQIVDWKKGGDRDGRHYLPA